MQNIIQDSLTLTYYSASTIEREEQENLVYGLIIIMIFIFQSQGLLHTFNMTETFYSKEEEEAVDRVLNFTTERGLDDATIIQRFDQISEEYDEVIH